MDLPGDLTSLSSEFILMTLSVGFLVFGGFLESTVWRLRKFSLFEFMSDLILAFISSFEWCLDILSIIRPVLSW